MLCTSLCSSGGRLMRRTSPCTRIIGGRPAERCRSEALFLTEKASSSEMSIYNPWPANVGNPESAHCAGPEPHHDDVVKTLIKLKCFRKSSNYVLPRRKAASGNCADCCCSAKCGS